MKSLKALLIPALLLAGQQGFAQDKALQTRFLNEQNLPKKDSLLTVLLKSTPEPAAQLQDLLRAQLAAAYVKNLDYTNYDKQVSLLKNKTVMASGLNSVAWAWAEGGEHLEDAAKLSKQSLELTTQSINDPALASFKKRYEGQYDSFADTYAYIMLKQNKPKEALAYQTPVYEHSEGRDAEVTEHYVSMLAADGQTQKAFEIADKSIRAGKSTGALRDAFQASYTKLNGAAKWPAYWASIEKSLIDNLSTPENLAKIEEKKKELSAKMINEPAPLFTLKDLSGKTVSLKSLKNRQCIG